MGKDKVETVLKFH